MWHAAGFYVKKQKLDFKKGAHTESTDSNSNHLLTRLRNDIRLLCTIISTSGCLCEHIRQTNTHTKTNNGNKKTHAENMMIGSVN